MKTLLLLQILFLVAQNGGYSHMPHHMLFAPAYIAIAGAILTVLGLLCGVVTLDEVKK